MQNRSWRIRTGLIIGLCGFGQWTYAANMGVFADAPYSYFTEKDRQLFHAALDEALNTGKENELRAWTNPESGSRGEITPIKSFERAGKACRQAKIFNQARGRRNESLQVFCRKADGTWKWEMPGNQ